MESSSPIYFVRAIMYDMKNVKLPKGMKSLIAMAKKDRDVIAVAVFGSFARKESHRDIDVCLFLMERMSALEMSRKRLAFLKHSPEKFDIHVFQQLPIYIRHRVLKEGKIIFCSDEDSLYGIASAAVKEYEDFRPIYMNHLEAVEHG